MVWDREVNLHYVHKTLYPYSETLHQYNKSFFLFYFIFFISYSTIPEDMHHVHIPGTPTLSNVLRSWKCL